MYFQYTQEKLHDFSHSLFFLVLIFQECHCFSILDTSQCIKQEAITIANISLTPVVTEFSFQQDNSKLPFQHF